MNTSTPLQINVDRLLERLKPFALSSVGGGNGAPPGAATPDQDPDSPKVRRNENERGEGSEGDQAKAEAMSRAPNAGAQ